MILVIRWEGISGKRVKTPGSDVFGNVSICGVSDEIDSIRFESAEQPGLHQIVQ